jgi:hypothetical protein
MSRFPAAISSLFDSKPPVLVEVRFPGAGTSPDWFLCQEVQELDEVLSRLAAGAEVRLSSVWDLKNVKGEV